MWKCSVTYKVAKWKSHNCNKRAVSSSYVNVKSKIQWLDLVRTYTYYEFDALKPIFCEMWSTPIGKLFKIFGVNRRNQPIWAFIWTNSNGKKWFWKYFTLPLLRSWPQVPQGGPMGPKILVNFFSHTMCIWYVYIGFFDLLAKNQSLFSDPSLTFLNIAIYKDKQVWITK